jgi:hypothetical protein
MCVMVVTDWFSRLQLHPDTAVRPGLHILWNGVRFYDPHSHCTALQQMYPFACCSFLTVARVQRCVSFAAMHAVSPVFLAACVTGGAVTCTGHCTLARRLQGNSSASSSLLLITHAVI